MWPKAAGFRREQRDFRNPTGSVAQSSQERECGQYFQGRPQRSGCRNARTCRHDRPPSTPIPVGEQRRCSDCWSTTPWHTAGRKGRTATLGVCATGRSTPSLVRRFLDCIARSTVFRRSAGRSRFPPCSALLCEEPGEDRVAGGFGPGSGTTVGASSSMAGAASKYHQGQPAEPIRPEPGAVTGKPRHFADSVTL